MRDCGWTCRYCGMANTIRPCGTVCCHCGKGNEEWHRKHLGSDEAEPIWEIDSTYEVLEQMRGEPEYDPYNPDNSPFSIDDFEPEN